VIVVVGLAAAALLAMPTAAPGRAGLLAAGLAVAAILAAPAAYSLDTVATAYSGPLVSAGPTPTATGGGGFGGGGFGGRFGGGRAGGGGPGAGFGRQAPPAAAPAPGGTATRGGGTSDSALLAYLEANRGDSSWLVAVTGAQSAAEIELQTGQPVMAMGGYSGSDNAPTLAQLEADVASGKLRFVLISGNGAGGGQGRTSSQVSAWVTANGTPVTINGATSSGATLYDLSGAATTAS
jgi:hypothetical protein